MKSVSFMLQTFCWQTCVVSGVSLQGWHKSRGMPDGMPVVPFNSKFEGGRTDRGCTSVCLKSAILQACMRKCHLLMDNGHVCVGIFESHTSSHKICYVDTIFPILQKIPMCFYNFLYYFDSMYNGQVPFLRIRGRRGSLACATLLFGHTPCRFATLWHTKEYVHDTLEYLSKDTQAPR